MSGGVEDVFVWDMVFNNVAYAFRLKVKSMLFFKA
jgi:hypothetical protein